MTYRGNIDEPDIARFRRAYEMRKANPTAALAEFSALAERGSVLSMINLGALYCNGQGIPTDHRLAEKYYRQAAELGVPLGNYCLGRLFLREKRYSEALTEHRIAYKKGYTPAAYALGRMYCVPLGIKQDIAKGERLLEFAAGRGSVSAKMYLAKRLMKDIAHPKRLARGLRLGIAAAIEIFVTLRDEGANSEKLL